MKRLKNIEGKNKDQLDAIKDQKEQLKMIEHGTNSAEKNQFLKMLSRVVNMQKKAEEVTEKIEKLAERIDYKNGLSCEGRKDLDFTSFKRVEDFAQRMFYGSILLKKSRRNAE